MRRDEGVPSYLPVGDSAPNMLNALSLWARRGGAKHRKNSPQATVFSQSGEVAMLRAGQALATWQYPGREGGQIEHEYYTSAVGDFSAAFGFRPHSGRNGVLNN